MTNTLTNAQMMESMIADAVSLRTEKGLPLIANPIGFKLEKSPSFTQPEEPFLRIWLTSGDQKVYVGAIPDNGIFDHAFAPLSIAYDELEKRLR